MEWNAGVSNIGTTEDNIKTFESMAKKYGTDFTLKKNITESPPRYLAPFKERDMGMLIAAFRESPIKKLIRGKKPSIRRLLSMPKGAIQDENTERTRTRDKDREVSL